MSTGSARLCTLLKPAEQPEGMKRGAIIRRSSASFFTVITALSLALVGCTGNGPQATVPTAAAGPSPTASAASMLAVRDVAALSQLDTVAAKSSAVDGSVTAVDCWTPSEHMVVEPAPASVFRVICRVRYLQNGAKRYKDMNCIGDFDKSPMLTNCYRWAAHLEMPTFEDGPSLASPSPTPPQ